MKRRPAHRYPSIQRPPPTNNDEMTSKSRQLLTASPVVRPSINIQHPVSNIRLPTSGFLDILEISMIAFNSFSGRHNMRAYRGAWLIVATFFFVHLPLRAQEARSTILGRITDPTGSVIVNATVEAANTDTGVRSTAQTNANGEFLLPF